MVQQEDASIARWRFGCDSGHRRAALVAPPEKHGPVVQRPRHLVHTQETMVQLHPGPLRLGRQLADHLGLEPGMLWVRLPPEPLRMITNDQCPRGAAWSARLLVTQENTGSNPVGGAWKMAWYANRQSGQAQTLVTAGSTPACATRKHASAGHR